MAEHNDVGKLGENIAAEYLLGLGYKVLRKNYRFRKGEIDIIAINPNGKFTFFEVKSRKGGGEPEQAVNKKKIKILIYNLIFEENWMYINCFRYGVVLSIGFRMNN